jgi:hypothetical protein
MSGDVISEAEIRRRVEERLKKRGEFFIHLTVYVAVNVALWVVWLLSGASGFPWPLGATLPWIAGLAGHGVDTFYDSSKRTVLREQAIRDAMLQIYGSDWSVRATQEDYNRIRKQIEKDYNKRKEFFIHLAIFLPINLLFWLSWLLISGMSADFPWPILLSMAWGIGLVAHGVDTYFQTGNRIRSKEAAIQREIEREREQMYVEKPKRSRLVIAEDGELMEVVEDAWEADEKPKRSSKR